jgi:uncharacterized membrane protein
MNKHLAAYAATTAALLMLDGLWLGLVAKPLYQQGIGHLMAEQPRWSAAAAFYLLYPLGVLVFVLAGTVAGAGWGKTLGMAALFGFFCYATYDLSNLATLKAWPASLALLDIAWGSVLTLMCAAAGKWAMDRLGGS